VSEDKKRGKLVSDPLVELAAVVRAHGLRGEVVLKPFNPESELLRELDKVVLKLPQGGEREYQVRGARGHADHLILALEGVSDRNQSESLRGSVVCAPRSALPPTDDDEVYLVDLVGLEARDGQGNVIGRVEEIVQYPSVACLRVVSAEGSLEVPDTERYLAEIDVEAGFLVIDHLDELDILRTRSDKDGR
jgi:16S rRNA processing protein RimM